MSRFVRPPSLRLAARITFALLAAALLAGQAPAAPPDGPVVIFLVDTLRPDRMSVYGAPHATTPAADRLAREATVFEHAYSLSSWTRASVGTLFTSLLPAEAGTLDRQGKLDPAVVTLPQLLQEQIRVPLLVRLYPKLDERLFDLARDADEKAGREVECGAPPPDDARALRSELEKWRARDVASFPRIDLERKRAEIFRFLLVMSLPDDPQPFLTTDETCRYAAHVRGSAFTFAAEISASEPFRLSITADEKGEVPPYRLTVFDAQGNVASGARRNSLLCTVRVERPTMGGQSEGEIRKLRNLGYLGGP